MNAMGGMPWQLKYAKRPKRSEPILAAIMQYPLNRAAHVDPFP